MLRPRHRRLRCGVTCFVGATVSWGHAATTMSGNEDTLARFAAKVAIVTRAVGMQAIVNNFTNMSSTCLKMCCAAPDA